MFTGIIQALGEVKSLTQQQSDSRLTVRSAELDLSDVALGDSIAVNGCCLTVISKSDQEFAADVSNETLRCTTLGDLGEGGLLNLEKAMLPTTRFGGHIVSGHVDAVGELSAMAKDGDSLVLEITAAESIARYIAAKGSITVDGTSLTVNKVSGHKFSVNIIPHTQESTIIGNYELGTRVNLEVDLIARYLERLMLAGTKGGDKKFSLGKLLEEGLLNQA